MYNFLFDKKSLVLVLGGMAMAGGLLFFGGVLVGVQWGLPMGGYTAPAPLARRAALPAELPANRPCKPEPEAAPAVPAAPMPAAPAEIAPEPPAPEPVEAEPQRFASVAPARLETRPVRQAAVPEPEPAPAFEAGGAEGRYSLQIGAFKRPENSEKVIQALQSRGYEPYVIEERKRNVLRTVRIGRYADRTEALRAASDFRRREGMEAIVRPLGS